MSIFKYIWLFVLMNGMLFGAKMTSLKWEKNITFSHYLTSRDIPLDLIQTISPIDKKFLLEIEAGQIFYELRGSNGKIEQVLIPLGEEMQIRLVNPRDSDNFEFEIIPIEYKVKEYGVTIKIANNLYTDVLNGINHKLLAGKVSQLFSGAVDTRKFRVGDVVSFVYTQKTRMGLPLYVPKVYMAQLVSGSKKKYIYSDEDGYGYVSSEKSLLLDNKDTKKITFSRMYPVVHYSSAFGMPLHHIRVTSKFTHRRYHPILKKYRPHHGTDFGARRGTPLLAVSSGKIIFSGWMGGYGKVVKIKHTGGYVSLYAHQSRIRVKRGQHVKRGQIIGYVGSTGRSTGAHLHLGLMRSGKWINPMRVLRKNAATIKTTTMKKKQIVIKDAKSSRDRLHAYLKRDEANYLWDAYKLTESKSDEK